MHRLKVFSLYGLKRSGNHAIVNWLRPQLRFQFVNNAIPIAPILEGRAMPRDDVDFHDWARRAMTHPVSANPMLISFEDHPVGTRLYRMSDGLDESSILLIRSFENCFSSRIRKAFSISRIAYPRENNWIMRRSVKLWKEHAEEYIRSSSSSSKVMPIYFDEWFKNRNYRETIASVLGCPFNDEGFLSVSTHGGGSSFDGTMYNGMSSKMELSNRRSFLAHQEEQLLSEIHADPEIHQLEAALREMDHIAHLLPHIERAV